MSQTLSPMKIDFYEPKTAEEAISLNISLDCSTFMLAIYKGYVLSLIKEKRWWAGKAETWGAFLADPAFNKVGQNQSEKYMRIYQYYCKRIGLKPEALEEVGDLNALDMGKQIIQSEDDWIAKKHLLKAPTRDVKENVTEEIGKEKLINNQAISWCIGKYKTMNDHEREIFFAETGLNHFTHQVRCNSCGSYQNLQHHHIVSRAQGGGDNPENIMYLCFSCHRKLHNGRN